MSIRVNVTNKIKLTCPECIKELNLVHLDFYALVCIHCKKEVRKTEFLLKMMLKILLGKDGCDCPIH